MKRLLLVLISVSLLAACSGEEARVMARYVPERADDFVFENNLIAGRFYGKALEGNPTSPGVDIWVKLPGKLVANDWYTGSQVDPDYYHHDHGGKDCYKVAVSLGGGASAPYIGGKLCYPATNYRSYEVLESSAEKVVFMLSYPDWQIDSITVSLDKKLIVEADEYFVKVEDCYKFTGAETLCIAAGIFRHISQETIEIEDVDADSYAIWEKASDQSIESEDGMLGVAVRMPGAEQVCTLEDGSHGICTKTVRSGEVVSYSFGSCWSKGDIKTAEDWFKLVNLY